jgi:adenylate kinase
VPHLSTGELLRQYLETERGRNPRVQIDRGMLVRDEVGKIVAERIGLPDCVRVAILDGFPRTIAQAEWLDGYLQKCTADGSDWNRAGLIVIKINVEENEVFRRLAGRRSCPACGRLYDIRFQPAVNYDVCDSDRAKLVIRRDDRKDLIHARLKIYEQETLPVAEYYRSKGQLREIDGSGSLESVMTETMAIIRDRYI